MCGNWSTRPPSDILAETDADELMLTAHIYDHDARLRSFELASHAMRGVGQSGRREAVFVNDRR